MKTAVRVEVDATSPPELEGLRRLHHVELNVLRARVTGRRSWFLLDISGAAAKVEAALRHFRERGFSIRTLSPGSSYA